MQTLFYSKENKLYLIIIASASILQFIIFKYFYPFPNFIHSDSFAYLKAAYDNSDISWHPIGYSKFLRFFSVFSTSDSLLVALQYILVQASATWFILTLIHFYKPRKWITVLIIASTAIDPISLHLSNLISGEALFMALSFTWLTILIWTLNRPTPYINIWHAVILFLAFTVRYNALYYPLISFPAILLSRQSSFQKFAGLAAGFLLIFSFYLYTSNRYENFIGQKVFSPFSGWQLANNALYAYRYIDSVDRKLIPNKFRTVDSIATKYFDRSRHIFTDPMESEKANTLYMWAARSPLQQYMAKTFPLDTAIKDSAVRRFQQWASAGPFLGEYGQWIIRRYPIPFAQHYLWPNTIKYFFPPTEYLAGYNMGRDTIRAIAVVWFGLKSKFVATRLQNAQTTDSLDYYPFLIGSINILFLCCFLCYCLIIRFRADTMLNNLVILTASIWLLNFIFSVLASSIALRFQIFPQLAFLPILLILAEHIYKHFD